MARSENVTEADVMIKKPANRPGGTKFKQQKLPAWQPVLSATTVLPVLLAVGLCFIPLGIAFIVVTNAVKEKVIDYTSCSPDPGSNKTCSEVLEQNISENCFCHVNFTLGEDFPGPVYVYYGLKSFYQNHRRYVKSLDNYQLAGDPVSSPSSDCDPFGKDPASGQVYAPCGAIANSLFNDTFSLRCKDDGTKVNISKNGIAWPTDLQTKFKNPEGYVNSNIIGPIFVNSSKPLYWRKPIYNFTDGYKNEDLIVWMRTAAFPSFRKLYGRINDRPFDQGLPQGNYTFTIEYNYPVSRFKGSKKVILSTTSFLGGKNSFLGIAYLVVGCLSLIIGLAFLIVHLRVGRRTQSSMVSLSKSSPYFDTTMADLLKSRMTSCY